jgi:ATP-dependent DNA ligase
VNLFLRYLSSVEGKGSQGDKIKKIIEFGKNVSVLEGIFLLKLIEKKLTIGASKKTFRKMD